MVGEWNVESIRIGFLNCYLEIDKSIGSFLWDLSSKNITSSYFTFFYIVFISLLSIEWNLLEAKDPTQLTL